MDALPPDLPLALRRRAEAGAAWVRAQKDANRTVTVVHHIDADGLSAAAIAASALQRAGVPFVAFAAKSMDAAHVATIRSAGGQALWFCDLGSTAYMHFAGMPRLVCDHHQLVRDGNEESFAHVNPLLDGLSGEEISGAGCAYLVAAALDPANLELLPLALVGASGDLQDRGLTQKGPDARWNPEGASGRRQRRFTGANAALVAHGCAAGLVASRDDLCFFGGETRPLRKFLALASEPTLPGLSGSARNVERLFRDAGVPLEQDSRERTWAMLGEGERRAVRSRIVEHLLDLGLRDEAQQLTRQVLTFTGEAVATAVREPQEFGTLLNSTARYGHPEVGLAVARGDRGAAYSEALGLLLDHRKHLAGALDHFARCGVTERTAVQWVHLEDRVLDTVVGIVCGMALDGLGLRRDLALIGFAWTPDGMTKVSSRSPHELQSRGIDLSTAMRACAARFGGQGGGHKGAAGATIPRGYEAAFVDAVDAMVALQLGVRAAPAAAVEIPVASEPTSVPFILPMAGKQARLAF